MILSGWLLDVYADAQSGLVVWLLGEDGQRYQLQQPFRTTFYAAGPFPRLRELWLYIRRHNLPVQLSRTQREDLFDGLLDVMSIDADAASQPALFRRIQPQFPDLDFYDADIPLSVQYAAQFNIFPTLKCQVTVEDNTDPGDSASGVSLAA